MFLRMFAILTLASPALADVIEVGPGLDHADLQSAVDAAADGDIVLVRTDQDSVSVVVDGKGLTILGSSSVPLDRVSVGVVIVQDLPAESEVYLANLWAPLFVTDAAGRIFVQGCTLEGVEGSGGFLGGPGALLERADDVVFVGCELLGGRGSEGSEFPLISAAGGGHGIESTDSTVSLYDSTVVGGDGGYFPEDSPGYPGGAGWFARRTFGFAANSVLIGGDGADAGESFQFCYDGGYGGDGARFLEQGALRHIECQFTGGEGGFTQTFCVGAYYGSDHGSPGDPIAAIGAEAIELSGPSPVWRVPQFQRSGDVVSVEIQNVAGGAYSISKGSHDLRFLSALSGNYHFGFLGYPDFFRRSVPVGPVTAGTSTFSRTAPMVPNDRILRIQEQVWIRRVGGHRLANPRITWILGADY